MMLPSGNDAAVALSLEFGRAILQFERKKYLSVVFGN